MLNEIENQFLVDGGCIKNVIYLIVEYERNKIFKSTLVSQLNENYFLFKDRLMGLGMIKVCQKRVLKKLI